MVLTISSRSEVQAYIAAIGEATSKAMVAFSSAGSPFEALRKMKFEQIGLHPIEGHALNLIEQLNQTFTYLVALKATDWLLERHPDAGGFLLAPGAKAELPLDIMSVAPGLVGAETFAVVHPGSNDKLKKDLRKLEGVAARYRYVFFHAPGFRAGRIERLERKTTGIEVHCVEI